MQAIGTIVVLEGPGSDFPLKLESLERFTNHRNRRPVTLLLSVTPATEHAPERAIVWISDKYRARFLKLFERYVDETTENGEPKNRALVANIDRIREAVLSDLWQSAGDPPTTGEHWLELWLTPDDDAPRLLREFAEAREMALADEYLVLNERTVMWAHTSFASLADLPFTRVPLTEIRWPRFAETVEDFDPEEQRELVDDLRDRIDVADLEDAPAVCHLDTGVRRSHVLLDESLAEADMHTIVGTLDDRNGHGTSMAGLALYGPIEDALLSGARIRLRHRLESVKFLPDAGRHEAKSYGLVTAQAVALPEIAAPRRRRVFCLPVTDFPDRDPGEPTLWSASVDAIAVGVDIGDGGPGGGITLLGAPKPESSRLILVSAGNVRYGEFEADYRSVCDLLPAEDPAQAWNALTVGAHTEMTDLPADADFADWSVLGDAGNVSPHSRTSVTFGRSWPIKPEICMEGGNVLTDGSDYVSDHPVVSLRTTDNADDRAVGSAQATSAATAQAARLAAMTLARYPSYWPETVRGLLVHAAEWTPAMHAEFGAVRGKRQRLALLRRYGWGVPREPAVLNSSQQAVTLITQDEFVPFDGDDFGSRRFRLHQLPWPVEVLRGIGAGNVTLRVTLSYFIEPTAARRGWRRRFSYQSHGLRFELKNPTETTADFLSRVNMEAQSEEVGGGAPRDTTEWLLGPRQRNVGSLHQDVWTGSGADLADCGVLAVHPVGGWWKNRKAKDRVDQPVRYSLLVSLRTEATGVDLYTPIATQLELPIPTEIEGT